MVNLRETTERPDLEEKFDSNRSNRAEEKLTET